MPANTSVASAMPPSASMISILRLCRSAHTPPTSDMNICGKNMQAM